MGRLTLYSQFLDCTVLGRFPEKLVAMLKKSGLAPVTEEGGPRTFALNTVDFIGCNYYQPLRVQAPIAPNDPITGPRDLFRGYDWPDKKSTLIAVGKSFRKVFMTLPCV